MKAQIVVDVVLIYVAFTPNMFHHNNVGVIYVRTSNFRVELIRSVPLHSMAMSDFMVTITEASFITTPAHTIVGMRSKPLIPKGINLVRMYIKMFNYKQFVTKIFIPLVLAFIFILKSI
jgi:hypothetical protein